MPGLTFFNKVLNRYRRETASYFERNVCHLRNRVPVVSFTFDDFPRTALEVGGAILGEHGFKATYFVSLRLMGENSPVGPIFVAQDLIRAVNNGHELGCHTYDHFDAWGCSPITFEQSIVKNREVLGSLLPGLAFKTFSYPKNGPCLATKRIAAKYFDCCRGGGQAINLAKVDANLVKSCFLDYRNRAELSYIKSLIDANSISNGWLVFSTHDICEKPSDYGCTPHFFKQIVSHAATSGASVLTFHETYSKYLACAERY